MMYRDIFGVLALLLQYITYLYVFSKIKGIIISKKFIVLFIFFEIVRGLLLGGDISVIFLPIELYLLDKYIEENDDSAKSLFYATYTFYFVFTFVNFFYLAFQEFISRIVFENYLTTFWLIFFLLTIISHEVIFKVIKLDSSVLTETDVFISERIITPLNKTLFSAVSVLLLIHYIEILIQSGTVSQYTKQIIFAYIFMIISVLILLNNKIVSYREEMLKREKEEQYRRLSLYTSEIEGLYQTVRGFKHDYKNMLITLRESIGTGDIENIQYLYETILVSANISLSEGENIDDLSHLKNPALKSLLYQKFNQARQDGVRVRLEIKDDVAGIQMELLDFVRVISILLDNAIEAAKETCQSEVFFSIIKQGERHIVDIKNTIKSSYIPINQIYKRGYTTKGAGRGEGLFSVRQIIQRYYGVAMETEIAEELFTQIVYIGDYK